MGHGVEDFGVEGAVDAAALLGFGTALGFKGAVLTIVGFGLIGHRGFIRVELARREGFSRWADQHVALGVVRDGLGGVGIASAVRGAPGKAA